MQKNLYKIIGAIFISLSGLFFTAERIAERVSVAIVDAGSASHDGSTFGGIYYPNFFDNFFVWFFLLIGLFLFYYGFRKA